MHIEYANPMDHDDSLMIEYSLCDNPVAQRWVQKVILAQQDYSIDDPARFYGFGTYESQVSDALDRINQCITVIKMDYPGITQSYVTDVHDQESLNYWHHVFEIYHGLLDNQPEGRALLPVLADLNIAVHRCESVARGAHPRHVVTWFGLPKTDQLENSNYQFFTDIWKSGTVFLNYVEIGKTLEDLALDKDIYIKPEAFQPFRRFSADFVVRFYEQTPQQAKQKRAIINSYYKNNKELFGPWQPCYVGGSLPVAQLKTKLDLDQISKRQYVKTITFT